MNAPTRFCRGSFVSVARRSGILAASVTTLLTGAFSSTLRAADGTWTGAFTSGGASANFTNTANWLGGTVAGGVDATASFVFDPFSDAGSVPLSRIAGGLVFNAATTLGNLVFDDLDGLGGASISLNVGAGGVQPLTLAVSVPLFPPTITVGALLNSEVNARKAVVNANVLGTDGLRKNGPGWLSFRTGTANTISGPYWIEGGLVEQRSQFSNVDLVQVSGGATLVLDFSTSGLAGTNRLNPAAPLILGGLGGGGVVTHTYAAGASNHTQTFNGVILQPGASQMLLATSGLGQSMTYQLGTIVNIGGGTLNFARPAPGGGGMFVANTATNGILGGWATVGGFFA